MSKKLIEMIDENQTEYENQNKKVDDLLRQVSINFSRRQDDFDNIKQKLNIKSE